VKLLAKILALSLLLSPEAICAEWWKSCTSGFAVVGTKPHALDAKILAANEKYDELLARGASAGELHKVQQELLTYYSVRFQDSRGYSVLPMQDRFWGEHIHGAMNSGKDPRRVKYFSAAEREAYSVHVDSKGFLRKKDGSPFDSCKHPMPLHPGEKGCFNLFVMDGDGKIFIYDGPYDGEYAIRHSSLLGGRAVASAGTISLKDGALQVIRRDSGHYHPGREELGQFIKELKLLGVSVGPQNLDLSIHVHTKPLPRPGMPR
jgi:hypothetical protein